MPITGLSLTFPMRTGFSGHDGHPVDEHLPLGLDDRPGKVLGAGGRPTHGQNHIGAAVNGRRPPPGRWSSISSRWGIMPDRFAAPFPHQAAEDK